MQALGLGEGKSMGFGWWRTVGEIDEGSIAWGSGYCSGSRHIQHHIAQYYLNARAAVHISFDTAR